MTTALTDTTIQSFSVINALGVAPIWVATGILILTYVILIFDKVNSAILAMLGASLMVLLGIINQQQATEGIDFNTLSLLIGMMIIVNTTSKSGLFQYVAIKSAKMVKADPLKILIMLIIITAVFSMLLDNVTTVLLIGPITLLIADSLKIKVFPFFFSEILASNIGGTATLIGDPPNIIIGSATGFSFNDFVINLGPVVVVSLIVLVFIMLILFKKGLQATVENREKIMLFDESKAITDVRLMIKSLFVLALVIAGFITTHTTGIEPGTSSLSGAALLLLIVHYKSNPETQNKAISQIFSEVEWGTIVFFAGLFIIVTAVANTGLLQILGEKMISATQGNLKNTTFLVLWGSGILSSFVNNIPFVATMIPLIESTSDVFGDNSIDPLWWALALGACFGGNGSLIGASANLTIAAYAAKAKQPIRFFKFFLYAFPIMILSLVISTIYLDLKYF